MSRKKRCLMMMESLPDEVVELILERLPVKSMLRFKAVSKQWKSTMESRFFKERQYKQRQQSGDPDVLMVSVYTDSPEIELLSTLVLGSSSPVKIPSLWEKENSPYFVSYNSCDGLVCIYRHLQSGFVVNPATRWYRPLPLSGLQQLIIDLGESYEERNHGNALYKLGFGKDIITGTYKAVWLYNSKQLGLENATTCEVFDFRTSSWRYVTPAASYRVLGFYDPVYVDGSLHWFTECEETKIVSFDLHTEVFQVMSIAPFANSHPLEVVMCNLDNRLCVSERKWPNQVIWSFNSGNKTWDKICTIDVESTCLFFDISERRAFHPLALLDGDKKKKKKKKKKKRLMFYCAVQSRSLLTLDPESKPEDLDIDVAFWAKSTGYTVCYFPSLFYI